MRASGGPGDADGQPRQGLRREVSLGAGATLVIFVTDRLVQVAFLAVLARLLGPAEFAVAAAASLFVSLVSLASYMGLGSALVQHPDLTPRTVSTARTMVLAVAAILTVAAELAAPLIGAWFHNPEVTTAVRVLAPLCLIQAVTFAPHAMLTRKLRARDLSLVDLASGLVGQGLVAIPLALAGWSYWALIAGAVAHALTRMIATVAMERPPGLRFDLGEARRLLSRGVGFSLTVFLQRAGTESDRILVGRYLGAVDLGLYARANGLMAFPAALFGTVVDRVAFPAFAQVQGEPERLTQAYAHGLALTALIGAPVTVMLFILGPEVIGFLLGAQWMGAVAPFKLLSLAAYFRMADRANGTVLRGVGKPYLMAGMQLVTAVATVVGCILVVGQGIAAVAGVVALASLLSFVVLTGATSRVAGVTMGQVLRAHGPALAAALLTAALVAPAAGLARQAGWGAFPTLAAAGLTLAVLGLPILLAGRRLFLGEAGMEALALLAALPSARLSFALRQRIKALPGVLAFQFRVLRRARLHQLVTGATQVCLEGFPRSGNGYGVACLVRTLPLTQAVIADHTHNIANIRRAVRRGLPTYVLTREPYGCCASVVAFETSRDLDDALTAYEDFHRALAPLADKVVIVPFEVLTDTPEVFVARVARDLGLATPPDLKALLQRDQWPPEAVRDRKQAILERELSAAAGERLARCRALRDTLLATAPDRL